MNNLWLNLGNYYKNIEKNYDLMKNNQRLYLMAIKNNKDCYINAVNNLGDYYKNIEKNYDKAEYYYLMTINMHSINNIYPFSKLAHLYYIQNKDHDKIFEYIIESIKLSFTNNSTTIENDLDLLFKLFEINIKYQYNINKDIINDIHTKYYNLLSDNNKNTLCSLIDNTDQLYCMF
jgi:hypothetical protein